LEPYTVAEPLISPNSTSGLPTLYKGIDNDSGDKVIIKFWQRAGHSADDDLEVIWRNEIRLLQRLAGYPGGRKYLITMRDAFSNSDGFYLILNTGNQLPIKCLEKTRKLSNPEERQLLWKNIRRLAQGLGALHSHGLIHRNLDNWAIFTENSEVPDYRLGGFEWSIRLGSVDSTEFKGIHNNNDTEYFSFFKDWHAFGKLIADMLGINEEKIIDANPNRKSRQGLSIDEFLFLRKLIACDKSPFDALNSDTIIGSIDKLLQRSVNIPSGNNEVLYLRYNHESRHHLWKGLKIDDNINKFDFLAKDLTHPKLLKLKRPGTILDGYALLGDKFFYLLKKEAKDWSYAVLDGIAEDKRYLGNVQAEHALAQGDLQVISGRIYDVDPPPLLWDQVIQEVSQSPIENKEIDLRYDAFMFLHLVELLHMQAMTWPITIQNIEFDNEESYLYTVSYDDEFNRANLRHMLGMNQYNEKPINQLIELLDEPQEDGQEGWQVANDNNKGSETDIWHFIETKTNSEQIQFRFIGNQLFSISDKLLLKSCGEISQEKLMQRRSTLLSKLKDHEELIELLSSPQESVRASHDPIPLFCSELDNSKKKALHDIFATLPIFLLQGPPGVGKTYLVTELINKCFMTDPTTRILVSAQGHNAINHLMTEICNQIESWPKDKQPLIVRSRSKKGKEVAGQFHIKNQAEQLLKNVIRSPVFKKAPPSMKKNIIELNQKIEGSDDDQRLPDTPLESLLLRSANLLFSTTNSGDLKNMLDTSARFDWSIIEEAGRATGIELLAPLMLSHRRLLIGDPKQLPPFGEDSIKFLLSNPEKLRVAFECCKYQLKKSHLDLGLEDLVTRFSNSSYTQKLTDEVSKTFLLFESLHREIIQTPHSLPAAGILNEQYRMHPKISDVVSKLFYKENRLETAEKTKISRLNNAPPFKTKCDMRLPDTPIVFIDTPWRQRSSSKYAEKVPAYSNPKEIEAIIEVLSLLRASPQKGKSTTLSVITPYNEQVEKIKRSVSKARKKRLLHLNDFDLGEEYVHTIDSFQGDEADIVVVSLVRNNERGYRKGLGILADARRMNVLFSRAKWKIIIIGSLQFLKNRFPPKVEIAQTDELRFIKDLTKLTYNKLVTNKNHYNNRFSSGISVVPFEELINGRFKK
jgi:serine/threonine protein kinase